MTRRHRYPLRSLVLDDVKAVAGLILSAGPLFLDGLLPVLFYSFAALTVLFAVFAAKTAIRHTTVIELSPAGISDQGPLGKSIGWEDVEGVELRYYSTRRDRERGWMMLRVRGQSSGRPSEVSLESSIDGFEAIATEVAYRASQRGVQFSPATRTNFEALGIALEPMMRAPV